MSRHMCNGIVTSLIICKKTWRGDTNFTPEDKKEAFEKISQFINIADYDIVEEDEEGIYLAIKENLVYDNIYELINEVHSTTSCNEFLFCNLYNEKIDTRKKRFTKENYPLKLYNKNRCWYFDGLYGKLEESFVTHPETYWLVYDNNNDLRVRMDALIIWFDEADIYIDNEIELLHILNLMKSTFYKSRLSKDLVFFIHN